MRAKRVLEDSNEREQKIFALGTLMGSMEVMKELLREEKLERTMIEALSTRTEETDTVLNALYIEDRGGGVSHEKMADATKLPRDTLAGTLKLVLESGAATAARSGNYTYYMLTKTGRRYIEVRAKIQDIQPETHYTM